jgi:lipoprotein-releasing system permease protein
MDFKLIRFISSRLAKSAKRQRFLGFTKSVAMFSVTLGTMSLILSLAILEGFDTTLHENAFRFTSHIIIKKFDRKPIENVENLISQLKDNFKEIKNIEPEIDKEALIRFGNKIEGVSFRGIFPEKNTTGLKNFIVEGSFSFSQSDSKEIIISSRLAEKIKGKIGDEVLLFTPKGNKRESFLDARVQKFKIKSIYRSGMVQYDDVMIFMPFLTAAKFTTISSNSATNFQITLHDVNKAPKLVDSIATFLKYPFFGFTVFDIHGSIFAWIELQKEPIPLILGLISIVAVLNIITALLVLILEKINSIGILRALGMNSSSLLSIFIFRCFAIACYGTLAGMTLAFTFSKLQIVYGFIRLKGEIYFLDKLPVIIDLNHYLIVMAATITLTLLATIIPALIAVKIQPVKALKFK